MTPDPKNCNGGKQAALEEVGGVYMYLTPPAIPGSPKGCSDTLVPFPSFPVLPDRHILMHVEKLTKVQDKTLLPSLPVMS